ncbi:MAG: Ser-Asp rich fibrinogen-binding,bone sialoprotein-binding protein [Thermoleophilia bacterium]|nr:Ser-Asp rich fibrinogen-binding,bone sialoprotein-binding protein [Thermoleophilia bacterium]
MHRPITTRRLPLLALVASLFALLAAPGVSSAATVARQTAPACDSYGSVTNWGPRTLTVPQFNPATGTLTGITLSEQVAMRSNFSVTSVDNQPADISIDVNGDAYLDEAGVPRVAVTLEGSRTFRYSGTGTFTGTIGPEEQVANVPISSFGAWTGTGSVSGTARATAATRVTAPGNADVSVRTSGDTRLCVTYDYTVNVTVCIGDYVWHDRNENGVQDAGEPPVAGRDIVVRDQYGNVLGSATTDASGHWTVCGLEPNTACVATVDLPDGWVVTRTGSGSDPAVDSNGVTTASGDATIACITPPTGSDLTFDVGIYQPTTPPSASSPAPRPALGVAKKVASKSIASKAKVVFSVTVKNKGAAAATNVTVCDAPPAQLAFVTRPKGTFVKNGKLCWTIKSLAAAKSVTFRYTMRAATVTRATCVVNAATAAATGTSGSSTARTCIRPGKLGMLLLAG